MEVWKDIIGYEGLYQISNLGNLRGLDRVAMCSRGRCRRIKGKAIRMQKTTTGYLNAPLCKGGVAKYILAHRLVAKAFVFNPLDRNEVNHIDEDKTNNAADNLEWVTHKENIMHGTGRQRGASNRDTHGKGNPMYGRLGELNPQSRPILQFDRDGNFLRRWSCAAEAGRELGINPSGIAGVARGRCRLAYGFKWEYENKEL